MVVGQSGRKLSEQVVETNAKALIECIRSIPRPRHVCLEEGTQSAWLYEILSPHADGLVLAEIRVAQLIPVVVTPHRFRTARQFWSYCGLGIMMRSSADWVRQAGTKPNLAKLTLARQIAATSLAMWKHEEQYDPARHHKQ